MVVECAVCVGDVESVMARVEGGVEVAGGVHEAVEEVLPCIDYENRQGELKRWNDVVIENGGCGELPRCEYGDGCWGTSRCRDESGEGGIVSACKGAGECGVGR